MNSKKYSIKSNSKFLKNTIKIIVALITVSLFGYFIGKFFINTKPDNTTQIDSLDTNLDAKNNEVEVDVIEIKKQNALYTQSFPAKVLPVKISPIRPQIEGVIIKQFFKEGSYVKRGDPLYLIDYAENITIRAPISGIIGRTYQTVGSLVTQNQVQPLAYITQPSPIYVDVVVPYSNFTDILRLKNASFGDIAPKNTKSNKLTNNNKNNLKYLDENTEDDNEVNELNDVINIATYEHEKDNSFLADVSISIENENFDEVVKPYSTEIISEDGDNSIVMRAIFANKNQNLISGTFVDAKIGLALTNAILIPHRASYILPNGKLYAWVVDGGLAKKKTFEASQSIGSQWIVESGINDGEKVIYAGIQKITEGERVNSVLVVPENDEI